MAHWFGPAISGALAGISAVLNVWQWTASRRFPIHSRVPELNEFPGVTVFKPLKGISPETLAALESWVVPGYAGAYQLLLGVSSETDPAYAAVQKLLAPHDRGHCELVVCPEALGANAKVSTLIQLSGRARHPVWIVSDADVRIEPGFLRQIVSQLVQRDLGLVHCFYIFANPQNFPMRLEALATNSDFWSQALMAQSLKPVDFALGAVMAFPRDTFQKSGGFERLKDYLADDYQLGRGIAGLGRRLEFATQPVECWEAPAGWKKVWLHQLRWARTIRICNPGGYFGSILNNGTLWPLLFILTVRTPEALWIGFVLIATRVTTALSQEARLRGRPIRQADALLVPVKDLLQAILWVAAFFGNHVNWRGTTFRVESSGRLTPR